MIARSPRTRIAGQDRSACADLPRAEAHPFAAAVAKARHHVVEHGHGLIEGHVRGALAGGKDAGRTVVTGHLHEFPIAFDEDGAAGEDVDGGQHRLERGGIQDEFGVLLAADGRHDDELLVLLRELRQVRYRLEDARKGRRPDGPQDEHAVLVAVEGDQAAATDVVLAGLGQETAEFLGGLGDSGGAARKDHFRQTAPVRQLGRRRRRGRRGVPAAPRPILSRHVRKRGADDRLAVSAVAVRLVPLRPHHLGAAEEAVDLVGVLRVICQGPADGRVRVLGGVEVTVPLARVQGRKLLTGAGFAGASAPLAIMARLIATTASMISAACFILSAPFSYGSLWSGPARPRTGAGGWCRAPCLCPSGGVSPCGRPAWRTTPGRRCDRPGGGTSA